MSELDASGGSFSHGQTQWSSSRWSLLDQILQWFDLLEMSFDKELSYVGKSGSATGTPVQGSDDQKINISSSEEKIPPYPDSSSQQPNQEGLMNRPKRRTKRTKRAKSKNISEPNWDQLSQKIVAMESCWHRDTLTRVAAIHLLQKQPEGSFVVRNNTTNTTESKQSIIPTISVCSGKELPRRIQHLPLHCDEGGTVKLLDCNLTFPDICTLVSHHCFHNSCKCGCCVLKLRPPTDIVDTPESMDFHCHVHATSNQKISANFNCNMTDHSDMTSDFDSELYFKSSLSDKLSDYENIWSGDSRNWSPQNEERPPSTLSIVHPERQQNIDTADTSASKPQVRQYPRLQESVSVDGLMSAGQQFTLDPIKYQLRMKQVKEEVYSCSSPSLLKNQDDDTFPVEKYKIKNEFGCHNGIGICREVNCGRSVTNVSHHRQAITEELVSQKCHQRSLREKTVFNFDVPATKKLCKGKSTEFLSALQQSDFHPSPVYAQPCDALVGKVENVRKSVSAIKASQLLCANDVRENTVHATQTVKVERCNALGRGSSCETTRSRKPPELKDISAGYQIPFDVTPSPKFNCSPQSGCNSFRLKKKFSFSHNSISSRNNTLSNPREGAVGSSVQSSRDNIERLSVYDNNHNRATLGALSIATNYSDPWEISAMQELLDNCRETEAFPQTVSMSNASLQKFECCNSLKYTGSRQLLSVQSIQSSNQENPIKSRNILSISFNLSSPSNNAVGCRTASAHASRRRFDFTSGQNGYDIVGTDSPQTHQQFSTGISHFGTGGDDLAFFQQKSPDVIPLISGPKLLSPKIRGHKSSAAKICYHVVSISQKTNFFFGNMVKNFIQCTVTSKETNPMRVISCVRQFINGMKNYLKNNGEGDLEEFVGTERSKMKTSDILNMDAIFERAMQKCVIKPLKEHINNLFIYGHTREGNLQVMSESIKFAKSRSLQELGLSEELIIALDSSIEVSKDFLARMDKTYSPIKKMENLLGALLVINDGLTSYLTNLYSSNKSALDLIPVVAYVIIEFNFLSAEIEADYVWGLLQRNLLDGQGIYYLTLFSSAISWLKSLPKRSGMSPCAGRSLPKLHDGIVQVFNPDEKDDSMYCWTLPVRRCTNARDICGMMAHQLRITNPQDFALYQMSNGKETHLTDYHTLQASCPEMTSSRPNDQYVYKRVNAKFIWSNSL